MLVLSLAFLWKMPTEIHSHFLRIEDGWGVAPPRGPSTEPNMAQEPLEENPPRSSALFAACVKEIRGVGDTAGAEAKRLVLRRRV